MVLVLMGRAGRAPVGAGAGRGGPGPAGGRARCGRDLGFPGAPTAGVRGQEGVTRPSSAGLAVCPCVVRRGAAAVIGPGLFCGWLAAALRRLVCGSVFADISNSYFNYRNGLRGVGGLFVLPFFGSEFAF